jgi:hypothetical protein
MHTDGNAIFNTLQQFGAALGTSVAAAIVAAGQKVAATQAAGTVTGSVNSFAVVAGLLVIEFVLVWWFTRRAPQKINDCTTDLLYVNKQGDLNVNGVAFYLWL